MRQDIAATAARGQATGGRQRRPPFAAGRCPCRRQVNRIAGAILLGFALVAVASLPGAW
jgi:hypothetical protein